MAGTQVASRSIDFRAEFTGRHAGSLLEIDASIPSEITAISPLVERFMGLIEASHCITGEEYVVELAFREALNNAVVHGNRLDASKLVHVRCRCQAGEGISVIVSDQGEGFDVCSVPDLSSVDNPEAEHGRGIHIMKWAMDEVSFGQGGTEVHMCKRPARCVDAVIDQRGNVVQASARSGHSLLIDVALKAVLQWKYEPTTLNGQPVSVEHVEVHLPGSKG